ncbi:MAG: carbohydrate binding domain-containing protein [Phycisphaerae bacterium]|nr:carbohydrate binding domain-containing protein [Phycisphaerae bacterium]
MANSSFETIDGKGMPKDWIWDRRNTDATCGIDTWRAHTGKRALRLTNGTTFGAHIYGLLHSEQPIALQPGKAYTLSAYVRSDDPGIAWVGGGRAWQYRLRFPATNGRWQRVWMTFKPSEADRDFTLLISTENPTKGVWIDDLKLEEGESPTPDATPDKQALLEPLQAEVEVPGDGPFEIPFHLVLPTRYADLTVRARLDRLAAQAEAKLTVETSAARVHITGEAVAMLVRLRALQSGVVRQLASHDGRRNPRGRTQPARPRQGDDLDDDRQCRGPLRRRCRVVCRVQPDQRQRQHQLLQPRDRRVCPGVAAQCHRLRPAALGQRHPGLQHGEPRHCGPRDPPNPAGTRPHRPVARCHPRPERHHYLGLGAVVRSQE